MTEVAFALAVTAVVGRLTITVPIEAVAAGRPGAAAKEVRSVPSYVGLTTIVYSPAALVLPLASVVGVVAPGFVICTATVVVASGTVLSCSLVSLPVTVRVSP